MNSKTTVRIALAAVGAALVITAHDVVQNCEFSPGGQTVR